MGQLQSEPQEQLSPQLHPFSQLEQVTVAPFLEPPQVVQVQSEPQAQLSPQVHPFSQHLPLTVGAMASWNC